ncbi:MAG: DNA mismatch repair protein MutS, partial [Alphaproteobacteria bacterium]|nr:DNA mismatch repair protein MutS [Alphaproteobacteria bacterium]
MTRKAQQNTDTASPDTSTDTVVDTSGMTPMMAQYMSVKAAHPGCLLFYRMGDFYELFFEDAEIASKTLDIALTKRGKHQGADIPMCGVPVHSHESYLSRLIRAGHRVAICEQTETPEQAKARGGYKALVARDVIRIITPGTLTEEALLDSRAANYLACVAGTPPLLGLAWIDMSTGAFHTQALDPAALPAALERLGAREVLVSERLAQHAALSDTLAEAGAALSVQPASLFDAGNAEARLKSMFLVGTLDAFGAFTVGEITAAGSLVDYIFRTQKGAAPRLNAPARVPMDSVVEIDAATRRNLELTRTLAGERAGSLLACVDMTLTGPGARLLAERIAAPSRDVAEINTRLDQIAALLSDTRTREDLRAHLRAMPDIERALSRLALSRGTPRDLAMIRDGVAAAASVRACLIERASDSTLDGLSDMLAADSGIHALHDTLARALDDDLPFTAREGGFIRRGHHQGLDSLRTLRDDSKKTIAALQADYAQRTGISALKVTYNNMLGYFIEVPARHADALMVHGRPANDTASDNPFVHRQTLANAVRFSTPELSELESKILSAADKSIALELEIFEELRGMAMAAGETLARFAHGLARIDVAAGFAALAAARNYTRPQVDESTAFQITRGRHPVVERAVAEQAPGDTAFVPNDCDLSPDTRLWLLTGPNMAGKSTFLRQNALIAILAQAGSFVPAAAAHIGAVDRIFSRVGASDDLARGRSTFMVEMVEAAAILNQATARSLVILDEIGRGTATFDGLS